MTSSVPRLRKRERESIDIEQFCWRVAKGQRADSAARAAARVPLQSDQEAFALAHKIMAVPAVHARLEQMRADIDAVNAKHYAWDAETVTRKLIDIAERCMQAEPVVDEFGHVVPGEWTFDATNANRALENVGRVYGMFVERRVNLNFNQDLDQLSDADLLARAKAARERAMAIELAASGATQGPDRRDQGDGSDLPPASN